MYPSPLSMAVLDDNRNTRPLVWPSVLTLVLFDSFWPRGRCAGRPTTNVTCRNTAPETQASVRPTCTKRMAARAAAGPPTVSVTWASVPLSTTSASRSGDTVSVDLASLGGELERRFSQLSKTHPPRSAGQVRCRRTILKGCFVVSFVSLEYLTYVVDDTCTLCLKRTDVQDAPS